MIYHAFITPAYSVLRFILDAAMPRFRHASLIIMLPLLMRRAAERHCITQSIYDKRTVYSRCRHAYYFFFCASCCLLPAFFRDAIRWLHSFCARADSALR